MIITPIQLRFNDIDIQGHMYNGQYHHIFDLGKSAYFQTVVGLGNMNDSESLITAHTSTNFYAPVNFDDVLVTHTRAEKVGTKSVTIFQQMINTVTGIVKADSHTVLVGYNVTTKETFSIPDSWRERIYRHESGEADI